MKNLPKFDNPPLPPKKRAHWQIECPHCDAMNLVSISPDHKPEYSVSRDEGLEIDCECFYCKKEFYFVVEVTLVSFQVSK